MAITYEQNTRPMKLTTPLGPNALLLVSFQGREGLSQMFRFDLQTVWGDKTKLLPFDQLLGKKVTIEISPSTNKRYINGIVSRISQGMKDENFTHYTLEVVPSFWLLDRKLNSRIFQHVTIPDILKQMLAGIDVDYQIQGTFEQREYCVQYRETDFAFASRLMEEEGIYYFFKHTASGHQMVLANTPAKHPAIPYAPNAIWDEVHSVFQEDRIFEWNKGQEIRSGKYVAWDEKFEMPGKHLEAEKPIQESVAVGTVTHKLKVPGISDKLEIYDFPGGYASRFDGVNKGGGDQPASLNHIFEDNARTVGIRMQEEALVGILIRGKSGHAGLTSGHTFDLTPPTLSGLVNKTVRARAGVKRVRVKFRVTARDPQNGSVPVRCKPGSGSRFKVGRTVVKCTATDTSANTATGTFKVVVKRGR